MPTEPIGTCKDRLHEDLKEVVTAIDFVTGSLKAKASSGELLKWVADNELPRNIVQDFRKSVRDVTDLNFLYQSLFVQAWSAFEYFIRGLISAYLEQFCLRASDYKSLKDAKLIDRNLYHSGIALEQILNNRSNFAVDFDAVATNVATSITGSGKVKLNVLAFGFFLKGPSVAGIEEALKRIGFKEFDWDNIGRVGQVQNAFGTNGHPRETANEVKEFLQRAERARNNIIHRGDNIQPVTEVDLRQYIVVFELLGNALAEFLRRSIPAA